MAMWSWLGYGWAIVKARRWPLRCWLKWDVKPTGRRELVKEHWDQCAGWITEAFWWAQCLHASNVMTRAIHISMKASLDWIKAIPLRPRFLLCIPDTLFLIFSPSPIFLCDLFALFIKGYTGTTGLKDSHYAENLEKIIVQLHACPHT